MSETLPAQWARIRSRLRAEYGEAAYRSWLKPLTLSGTSDEVVQLTVPTRFMRDWVEAQYGERLLSLWAGENASIKNVDILLEGSAAAQLVESQAATMQAAAVTEARQTDISAPLDPRFTFDNFIVGKPNELAFAAARRVAEAATVPFNPLFLYGGVGLGKTHLLHAIAWHIRKRTPERRVVYLSAEKFMYQFIRALRYKDTVAFKEQFRSVDVLMIDDVQFIAGKDNTQEEFFHTFNALVDQNHQVIISADKSPNDLEGMEDRMKSRLGWGLVADIHPTTYELRLGILQVKAEQLEAEIPPKVMEFLAHKITSNVRELEGALNRIVAYANLVGRSVSLEGTQEVLHDILRANDRRVTIEEIQKRVAEHYNIRQSEMYSSRRARGCSTPPSSDVPFKAIDISFVTRNWSEIWWPRSYNSNACGAQNRGVACYR